MKRTLSCLAATSLVAVLLAAVGAPAMLPSIATASPKTPMLAEVVMRDATAPSETVASMQASSQIQVEPAQSLTETTVTISAIPAQVYTGAPINPSINIFHAGKKLVNNQDYAVSYSNNLNVGTARVVISGKGAYTGVVTRSFLISPRSIHAVSVGAIKNQTYTGKALKPRPTIKHGATVLRSGADYTIKSYSSNKSTGKAKITIIGKGNYAETRAIHFKIVPKKPEISILTRNKKGALTVCWYGVAKMQTGYQVQVATNKKFTKGKKSSDTKKQRKAWGGLSYSEKAFKGTGAKKTYFARVRGYKVIDGKKQYGPWSAVAKIRGGKVSGW